MEESKINEVMAEINKILDYLKRKGVYDGYDGELLTSGGMKLSLLKVTLGDMIADLETQSDLLEVEYGVNDVDEYIKHRDEGKSQDDSKMLAKKKLAEQKKELIGIQGNVRKLKVYHKNVTDVMTNIQTRVSYLKHERNEQNLTK